MTLSRYQLSGSVVLFPVGKTKTFKLTAVPALERSKQTIDEDTWVEFEKAPDSEYGFDQLLQLAVPPENCKLTLPEIAFEDVNTAFASVPRPYRW